MATPAAALRPSTFGRMNEPGGTTDIFGVGRIVDEASEVIHELDRPTWSHYEYSRKKNGNYARSEWHVSKLDAICAVVLGLIVYQGVKVHMAGGDGSAQVNNNITPFGSLLANTTQRITPPASGGGGEGWRLLGGPLTGGKSVFEILAELARGG